MTTAADKKNREWLITGPSLIWLLLFFVIPTLIVFAIAFKPSTPFGGIGAGWTLTTLFDLSNPNYPAIIWRTVWISLVSTIICLLLAVPCGYCIARARRRSRNILLMLVIVPFWTNFHPYLCVEGTSASRRIAQASTGFSASLFAGCDTALQLRRGSSGYHLHLPAICHSADLCRR
jgi:ABC-type polysaccharide transport system permease subunit